VRRRDFADTRIRKSSDKRAEVPTIIRARGPRAGFRRVMHRVTLKGGVPR